MSVTNKGLNLVEQTITQQVISVFSSNVNAIFQQTSKIAI